MLVTINTDASFRPDKKLGGFAFWAVCNNWKLQKSGVFRELISTAQEAEMKCIINAVYLVLKHHLITSLRINTDSQAAIDFFSNPKAQMNKQHWAYFYHSELYRIVNDYKCRNGLGKKAFTVRFAHVKAHKSTNSPREWVNDWCDKNAKEALVKKLKSA